MPKLSFDIHGPVKTQKQKTNSRDHSRSAVSKEISHLVQDGGAEVNEIEMKKTIEKINKTKSWFFEKINKIDKPLARLIKKKWERTQFNKIRHEKGEITTATTEIQRI